jgi:hypothetical protein
MTDLDSTLLQRRFESVVRSGVWLQGVALIRLSAARGTSCWV